MRNGKRLTRREKIFLSKIGLNPDNWLVNKRPPGELHLTHRYTGQERVLHLGKVDGV